MLMRSRHEILRALWPSDMHDVGYRCVKLPLTQIK